MICVSVIKFISSFQLTTMEKLTEQEYDKHVMSSVRLAVRCIMEAAAIADIDFKGVVCGGKFVDKEGNTFTYKLVIDKKDSGFSLDIDEID